MFVPVPGRAQVLLVSVAGENRERSDQLRASCWVKRELLGARQAGGGSALPLACTDFPKCIYSCEVKGE